MGKRYLAEDGSPVEPPMHPFRTSRGGAQRRLVATSGDLIFQSLSTIVAFSVLGLLALIAAILFVAAEESVRTFGFGFLGGTVWDPVSQVFGAAPFTYGMLVTSALALVLGVPISLGIAIFLSELAPGWLRAPLACVVRPLGLGPAV